MKSIQKASIILVALIYGANLFAFIPKADWLLKKAASQNQKKFLKFFSINVAKSNLRPGLNSTNQEKDFFILEFKAPGSLVLGSIASKPQPLSVQQGFASAQEYHLPLLLEAFLIDLQNKVPKEQVKKQSLQVQATPNIDEEVEVIQTQEKPVAKTFLGKALHQAGVDTDLVSLVNLGGENFAYLIGARSFQTPNNALWLNKKTLLPEKVAELIYNKNDNSLVETYFKNWVSSSKMKYPKSIEVFYDGVLVQRYVLNNLV